MFELEMESYMSSIVSASGETLSSVPKVKDVHPFGSTILIENLSAKEQMGTDLLIDESANIGQTPQAYILALGPKLDPGCGLKVGDRIVVQGSFVPMPNVSGNGRVRGTIELHNVKAVIEEA